MWTLPGTGLFAPEKAERPGGYFTGQEAQAADGPASGLGGKEVIIFHTQRIKELKLEGTRTS